MKHVTWLMPLAIDLAQKSTMSHKHSAILFSGSTILGVGHNFTIEHFLAQSIHAEIAAIYSQKKQRRRKSAYKSKKLSIFIVRLTPTNKVTYSKPCQQCFAELKRIGVRKIYYTGYDNEIICQRVSQMDECDLQISSGTRFSRK